jgi:hypothetical protein
MGEIFIDMPIDNMSTEQLNQHLRRAVEIKVKQALARIFADLRVEADDATIKQWQIFDTDIDDFLDPLSVNLGKLSRNVVSNIIQHSIRVQIKPAKLDYPSSQPLRVILPAAVEDNSNQPITAADTNGERSASVEGHGSKRLRAAIAAVVASSHSRRKRSYLEQKDLICLWHWRDTSTAAPAGSLYREAATSSSSADTPLVVPVVVENWGKRLHCLRCLADRLWISVAQAKAILIDFPLVSDMRYVAARAIHHLTSLCCRPSSKDKAIERQLRSFSLGESL